MTKTQNMTVTSHGLNPAVHLLLTQGEVRLLASDPKRAMVEIEVRATTVGCVLEQILREPHHEPDWGLNE